MAKKKTPPPPARTSLSVSPEVAERLRDCAYHERLTVVELTEAALLAEVERLEQAHGESFTYPPRPRR